MALGNIKLIFSLKGKNVRIAYCSPIGPNLTEKGEIVQFVGGAGENGVFVELDSGILINTRYIVTITLLD